MKLVKGAVLAALIISTVITVSAGTGMFLDVYGTIIGTTDISSAVTAEEVTEHDTVTLENHASIAIAYDRLTVSITYEKEDKEDTTELTLKQDDMLKAGTTVDFDENDFDEDFPEGDWTEVAVLVDGNEVHSVEVNN